MDEIVEILQPPLFTPTGKTKTRHDAYRDGDWLGVFNLWVVTRDPEPAIVYQRRSPTKPWAPNMLDVTAGGQLLAGEKLTDGLREVEEELGKHYSADQIIRLGRKLYVGFNSDGTSRNDIIDLYMTEDNSDLSTYNLQAEEVYALCKCPVKDLLRVHQDPTYRFRVNALTAKGQELEIEVGSDSFPENWDNYHYKIAVLVDRYFRGDRDLLY